MAYTNINSEDRLVQATFAAHLADGLGWESVYAYNHEDFGPGSLLGRADDREVVLKRDLRAAVGRLNPSLPESALNEAVVKMAAHDFSRSILQHNQQYHDWMRNGVPVEYRDATGAKREVRVQVIDFENKTAADGTPNNRFLAVRELWIKGLRAPGYRRRADLVCDQSKPGATRKVVARNHQVLGVNRAVDSVRKQEELKIQFPPGERLVKRLAERVPKTKAAEALPQGDGLYALAEQKQAMEKEGEAFLELVEPVHPELGKLGVFWQTQGSGKSYSMVFFAEKVRRRISKKFTFVFMTDRMRS